jgi:periplasmic copper chaperone A
MVDVNAARFVATILLSAALSFCAFGAASADDLAAAIHNRPSGSLTRDLSVERAWARATPPGVSVGAVYLTLKNRATLADALTGVQSPSAAQAEIHVTRQENGIMSMRRVDTLDLPPGKAVRIEPGGVHIMLLGLNAPLVVGDHVHLTLRFKRHSPVELDVPVREQP